MAERHIGTRELRDNDAKDIKAIKEFIAAAPRYETLLMRPAAAAISTFKGWWLGAFEDGNLLALACVEGTTSQLYSRDPQALQAIARFLIRAGHGRRAVSSVAHQILGSEKVVEHFWSVFKDNGKTVVRDTKRKLLVCSTPAEPGGKASAEVTPASSSDFRLIYEYSADQVTEEWGLDPRRSSKVAHEKRCQSAIAEGRQLMGRERGKVVFTAELNDFDEKGKMLDRIHVPRNYRKRRIMARSIAKAAARGLATGAEEVLMFVDEKQEHYAQAAELAGFEVRCTYRLIIMRG